MTKRKGCSGRYSLQIVPAGDGGSVHLVRTLIVSAKHGRPFESTVGSWFFGNSNEALMYCRAKFGADPAMI